MLMDNEIARVRALSINVVRTIADRHGGMVDKNFVKDHMEIVVSVPDDQRDTCSQEITDQLKIIHTYFATLLAGLLYGKLIVRINNN